LSQNERVAGCVGIEGRCSPSRVGGSGRWSFCSVIQGEGQAGAVVQAWEAGCSVLYERRQKKESRSIAVEGLQNMRHGMGGQNGR